MTAAAKSLAHAVVRNLRGAGLVAQTTFVEALRNRLLWVGLVFALLLVGLSVAAASVAIWERARLIIDVGLGAASAVASLIAVALCISTFAGELQRRTVYPVLVRPLSRGAFVLGKYLGVVLAMQTLVALMGLATAATVRLYGGALPPAFWIALGLTAVEIALVCAVALLYATLTGPVLAATYAGATVLAGHLSEDLRALAARDPESGFGALLRVAYRVLPDLQGISARGHAANSLPVPAELVTHGTLYGLAYAATAVALAMAVFSRRRVL